MIPLLRRLRRQCRRLTCLPRASLAICRVLHREFGYFRTVRDGEPRDEAGREIPWFTYPAIEYLEQLDLRGKSIFEFGTGHSTIFWSRGGARVTSVESNPAWLERVRPRVGANVELIFEPDPVRYAGVLDARAAEFDVIVVDGIERRACCAAAIRRLKPGGMIILDNADWHELGAADLRQAGLLEVDMTGFGPINPYTWTTSFFFHREFDFPPRHDRQPVHGRGSLPHREGRA